MLDKLLENLDDVAGKLGLPADQIKNIAESLSGKLGQGGDHMATIMETAQQHGLPVEKLQELLGGMGVNAGEMMEKASEMLGGQEGEGGALGKLAGMAQGLFGKE